jgi:hypothetical protein
MNKRGMFALKERDIVLVKYDDVKHSVAEVVQRKATKKDPFIHFCSGQWADMGDADRIERVGNLRDYEKRRQTERII